MEGSEVQLLKIGELAALAGVSVKALRVYEKKNVIMPVMVGQSIFRVRTTGKQTV